jgi:WD40 repeat protein
MSVTLSSCDLFLSPIDQDPVDYVRTTITGRVTDEAGKSVQGALVKGHGASTTTNSNGVFVLRDVAVPSTRAVITVSKGGYFTGARAAYPSALKTTTMLLTLQDSKVTRTLNAATGGMVTVGAASVELPANGFADAQGNAYTGTVSVAVRYLDPASDDFYSSFSGDMAAARADGSATELISYGVLRVKLTGSQGQELNLRKGSAATLTYPAAGATDASIPLWFFDETEGIWVEEGTAVRSGNNYVGTVQHFTDWNLDKPTARSAYIEGRVTCGANVPLAGIVVDIGQVSVVTDQDGMYKRRVPADVAFDVTVKGSRNEGISSSSVTVGPIAQDQTLKHDIAVAPCPTLLEARIVDCNNNPVGGFVQVITPSSVKIASSTTGRVLVTVPAGVALTIEGYSTEGRTILSTPIAPIAAGSQFNAGNLQACSGVATEYLDIVFPKDESPIEAALNSNGSLIAVVTKSNAYVFDAVTGRQRWSTATHSTVRTTFLNDVAFVSNDNRLALMTSFGTTVFDVSNGKVLTQITARGRQHIARSGSYVYVLSDTSAHGAIDEYDATSGAFRRTISVGAAIQKANFLGLQGNNRAVVQSYSSGAVHTIDLATGSVLSTYKGENDSTGISESATLSPSGNVIILLGRGPTGRQLTAVDLVTGAVISRLQSSVSILAISPADDQYVWRTYTQRAATTLSTLRTQQLLRILPWASASQEDYPTGITFSGDGSKLAGFSANPHYSAGIAKLRVYNLQ